MKALVELVSGFNNFKAKKKDGILLGQINRGTWNSKR